MAAGNVIEVDFARGDEDVVTLARSLRNNLAGLAEDIQRRDDWLSGQLAVERRRSRELQAALTAERARAFPFTADEVLAALRGVFDGEPVTATPVASALTREPTHSIVIRVGRLLSQLARDGRVEKIASVRRYGPHRWVPKGAV